ncbi:LEPBI_I2431 family sigma-54 regulated protein [Leptospira meyeri]|uniref:LEPBI_I2431 family sigma-54 regulated protein n=1 Tax=Leptospira meyeri TaxID=29508 RepID=UPI000C2A2490|nr:PilZ domain-containing protein [Leptospira meyeri]PKA26261.1 PilZ domain-containing protein [Leptospira sp. mixed culture ATI2-C-A1]MCW7487359.1 PilZ domain-containing protein [Leptospira meyeri]PJZ80825.1 PilZ domain-containing protein [Leptospira meyeri]PJZ96329.1 PilZ domain-containing protein [Leptospira meyeri]PKA12684.1 PilZ domain-containing protein [Leptospira meyeri]
MLNTRRTDRIESLDWDDLVLKLFSINERPEFLLAKIGNISELGVSGFVDQEIQIKDRDLVTGIIESDLTRSRISFKGKIAWMKETNQGLLFGIKFSEELILPNFIIARSIAESAA